MALIDVIERKKLGFALSRAEIDCFVKAAVDPATPDYQLSALLMAIRLNGMTAEETAMLTLAMAESGDMLIPDVDGIPVDKHSTGGVADTTTLVLVPLVAACGAKVIKMSGRGLGHTGGTIDKMESIPGLKTDLPEKEILRIVREVGCCVAGQTGELTPADRRLYALRDVTSTVDSVPLIASSIMSKKLASGAQGIVLDIKVGQGALMKTVEDSIRLAQAMVSIGQKAGRRVRALLTGMEEPLGDNIGNALEVQEAIEVLAGRGQGPLLRLSLRLGEQMLALAGIAEGEAAGGMLRRALESGAGLRKLREMIQAQGGDGRVVEDISLLPQSKHRFEVLAERDGYVHRVDALGLGLIAQGLGAGRLRKEDPLDSAVGLVMHRRMGSKVRAGEPLITVHANDVKKGEAAQAACLKAMTISGEEAAPAKLFYALVTDQTTEVFE